MEVFGLRTAAPDCKQKRQQKSSERAVTEQWRNPLEQPAKYGIFGSETTPKRSDSDPYVKFNIGVVTLRSQLCAAVRSLSLVDMVVRSNGELQELEKAA